MDPMLFEVFLSEPLGLYFVSTTVPPPNYPVYTSSVRKDVALSASPPMPQ